VNRPDLRGYLRISEWAARVNCVLCEAEARQAGRRAVSVTATGGDRRSQGAEQPTSAVRQREARSYEYRGAPNKPPHQIVGTSFESMMRLSEVTRGTPWTRAVATMIRSAGSQCRVDARATTSLAIAGVAG